MRKTVFVCDRCGKVIENNVVSVAIGVGPVEGDMFDFDEMGAGADLCQDCYEDLQQFLKSKPTPEPQAKPRRKGARIELDLGKMAALRNAGWSYDKIADELHVSQGTVINWMPEALEFINSQEADL